MGVKKHKKTSTFLSTRLQSLTFSPFNLFSLITNFFKLKFVRKLVLAFVVFAAIQPCQVQNPCKVPAATTKKPLTTFRLKRQKFSPATETSRVCSSRDESAPSWNFFEVQSTGLRHKLHLRKIPCLSTRWGCSLYTVHELSSNERKSWR